MGIWPISALPGLPGRLPKIITDEAAELPTPLWLERAGVVVPSLLLYLAGIVRDRVTGRG